MQSIILKIYEFLCENIEMVDEVWKRDLNLADKFENELMEAIKDNEKLKELYSKLSRVIVESHVKELEATYKAGFKDGAKIILEVYE